MGALLITPQVYSLVFSRISFFGSRDFLSHALASAYYRKILLVFTNPEAKISNIIIYFKAVAIRSIAVRISVSEAA